MEKNYKNRKIFPVNQVNDTQLEARIRYDYLKKSQGNVSQYLRSIDSEIAEKYKRSKSSSMRYNIENQLVP